MSECIKIGDTVQVTFPDGSEIRGKVRATIEDNPHWVIVEDCGMVHYVMQYSRLSRINYTIEEINHGVKDNTNWNCDASESIPKPG